MSFPGPPSGLAFIDRQSPLVIDSSRDFDRLTPDAKKSVKNIKKIGGGLLLIAVLAGGVFVSFPAADFSVYYSAAKQLIHHDYDLYRQGGLAFRYAPVVAFAFVPISILPPRAAASLWYLLKIGALVAIAGMVMKLLAHDRKRLWKILGLSVLITAGYLVEEFRTGNIHFLILFLIVLAFFLVERGRIVLPSFLLAAAICVKVTPLLFLPYFALMRRWKLCLFCVLWIIVLVLGPGFLIGWEKNIDLAKHWTETALARTDEPVNHSLKGVLFKYLGEKPPLAENEKYPRVNVFDLRPEAITAIWILASALFLVLLAGAILRRCGGGECAVLQYALLAVSVLLLSPHDSRIYFSILFFPCAVIAAYVDKHPGSEYRSFLFAVLGVSFAFNTFLPAVMPGKKASLAYETLSPYFFSALIVWIALFILVFRQRNIVALPE